METVTDFIPILEKRMRHISGAIKQSGRKILKNYPITSPQFIALQWIIEENNLTIGELSNKIGLAFSTTTDLVDRLEKSGLVQRTRDESDRRVVRIVPLEKGKAIIHEVIEKRQKYLGEVMESFTTEQAEALDDLLKRLYENMKNINER